MLFPSSSFFFVSLHISLFVCLSVSPAPVNLSPNQRKKGDFCEKSVVQVVLVLQMVSCCFLEYLNLVFKALAGLGFTSISALLLEDLTVYILFRRNITKRLED